MPTPEPEAAVRARILAAARAEFAAKGEGAASVRTIGERAGVTAAMINYYFGGKRALYDEVVVDAQGRLHAQLSAAIAAGGGVDLAAVVAGAYFDFLAEHGDLQRLFLREVLDGGERSRAFARRFVAPLGGLLAKHFGKGDEVTQLAISLFGAVAGYFLYEPILAELLGDAPLSAESLKRRRKHVIKLAHTLSASRATKTSAKEKHR